MFIPFVKSPTPKPKSRKGFAAISREQQRALARKGGKAAQAMGVAHRWDVAEARAAGQKGGVVVASRPDHMAEIGRRGGHAKKRNADARLTDTTPHRTPAA